MILTVSADESRYDRQERITWWDQERLAEARVLVVGAGALGNEVVKNLVLVGVGSVVVVDFDSVELSNLARCAFFRDEDEGLPKATVLADRARILNPHVEVEGIVADIRSFGVGLALRADVMVGALDSREARLVLNRLAWRVGRPWVDGAIEALQGVARVFSPPGPCYECTLTDRDFEILSHRQSCRLLSRDDLEAGKVPTTATTASIVGGLQAQEVVKLLHRDSPAVTVAEGAYVMDGANNDTYPLTYAVRDDCLAHDEAGTPVEVAVDLDGTFRDVLAAGGLDGGLVELGDDHLTGWRCPACADVDVARGPVWAAEAGAAVCPRCQGDRLPETTTAVAVEGPYVDETIGDFGVKADEVLPVRRALEYRWVRVGAADPRLPAAWS